MKNSLSLIALVIGIIALVIGLNRNPVTSPNSSPSALDRIQKNKVLRTGYISYFPYSTKDPKTGLLSGYSVDMVDYIAKQTGWKVEWIETTSDTMISDLQSNKFDVVVTSIFRTIPRATRVTFTRPYAYFGYAGGLVKKGDTRFRTIEDLNNPNITVAVTLGDTDQSFIEQNLPKAKLKTMKVDDVSQVYADVLAGNSDISLSEILELKAYAKEHSDQVDTLFTNPPPASVPAGFMVRQGDFSFYNFLNTAIDYMETNKVLDALDKKYNVSTPRTLK